MSGDEDPTPPTFPGSGPPTQAPPPGTSGTPAFLELPEVGDEVIVSFVHGDEHEPMVIGSLWNDRDEPQKAQGVTKKAGTPILVAGPRAAKPSASAPSVLEIDPPRRSKLGLGLAIAAVGILGVAGLAAVAQRSGGGQADDPRQSADVRVDSAAGASATAAELGSGAPSETDSSGIAAVPPPGSGGPATEAGPQAAPTTGAAAPPPSAPVVNTSPTPPEPSTTAPPDTAPPVLGAIGVAPPDIWEKGANEPCVTTTTAAVSVAVSDASAIDSVVLAWTVGATNGSVAMAFSGGRWTATTAAFPAGTVPKKTAKTGIAYTVTAQDVRGNKSTSTAAGTLHSAEGC